MQERLDFVIAKRPVVLPDGEAVTATLTSPELPPGDSAAGVEAIASFASTLATFLESLRFRGEPDSRRAITVLLVSEFINDKRLPFALAAPSDGGDGAVVRLEGDWELGQKSILEWLALEMGVERDSSLPAAAGLLLDKVFMERPGAGELIRFAMAKVNEWLYHREIVAWAVRRAETEPARQEGNDVSVYLVFDRGADEQLAPVTAGSVQLLACLMERAFAKIVPVVARRVEQQRQEDAFGGSLHEYSETANVGITIVVTRIVGSGHFEFQLRAQDDVSLDFTAVHTEASWWRVTAGRQAD